MNGVVLITAKRARTGEVVDGHTGQIIPVQIFVAVLGVSSFTNAAAVWSQKLPDWIGAHVRAFAYLGGAARQTVSDNLKAGVTRASFHEPMINCTYADMARHYRTVIVPARPYKPRDKAKVEVGVQVVGRWILARLPHRRFFSLFDLNAAIRAPVHTRHPPAGPQTRVKPTHNASRPQRGAIQNPFKGAASRAPPVLSHVRTVKVP